MQAIGGFRCSLAITRSNLFGLERLYINPFTPALRMFPLYSCDFFFPTHVIVYWEHTRRGQLERFDWESNIFPRSAILPVLKVSSSTILMASGLQRGLDVVITVRKGVKYLEDQNRRYDQEKMPPLLYRILILRKNFLRICIEQWGRKNFPRGDPKKLPVGKFSELDFDRFTDTNSSLSTTMTFILKMTKFWVFSNAKG